MWEIVINISINGSLNIYCRQLKKVNRILGSDEGIKIKFFYMLSLYRGKEVLHFIKELLNREENENIDWIIPNNEKWKFDLDKLREVFPELSGIEWLKGKVALKPEIYVDPNQTLSSKGTNITFYITKETVRRREMYIKPPKAIEDSIKKFQEDYQITSKTAFIMMQYGESKAYSDILEAIKNTLEKYEINGVIAKDKEYHDDLYYNILTYIFCCDFGIAVFERIDEEEFNPNVSLEVGHLLALQKPVCLLKDKTLPSLQTDIVGRIYREFDTRNPEETIPEVLTKWIEDKGIIEG